MNHTPDSEPKSDSDEKPAEPRSMTITEANALRAQVGDLTSITSLLGRDKHGNRRRVRKSAGPRHWGYWA